MEVLLNAVWFGLVAVAGVSWLRNRWRARTGRQFWLCVVAFVCAAFILFPVISITDDLHPAAYLAEEARSSKQSSAVAAHLPSVTPPRWLGVSVVALLLALVSRSRWMVSHPPAISDRTPLVARVLCDRAPPTALAL